MGDEGIYRIALSALQDKPAVPDGWKLVPIEPTEDMIIKGFESAPSMLFSNPDDWDAYVSMSGCRRAAYKASRSWAAMLAAAPAPGDES